MCVFNAGGLTVKDDYEEIEVRIAKQNIERKYQDMNIRRMYFDATLENFIADTEEQKKVKVLAEQIINGELRKLVMLGKNGVGKTHIAVACIKKLGGYICTAFDMSTRIRATYTPKATETEYDIITELQRVPCLVIDEIGRTKGSGAEMNWFSAIIDYRHAELLPTILISNNHPRAKCEHGGCDRCIDNYVTPDVMSRLNENGIMITMNGEDYRRKK
jgi:DNA replication protein DnaC